MKIPVFQDFLQLARESPGRKRCPLAVGRSLGAPGGGAQVLSGPPGEYGRKAET